jgi:prevent-host-death family protein
MVAGAKARKSASRTHIPADEARDAFGDVLDRAGYRGERIVVTRHGKDVVAIVSIADLEKIEAA